MAFTSVSVLSCFEVCRVFDTAFGAELYEKSFYSNFKLYYIKLNLIQLDRVFIDCYLWVCLDQMNFCEINLHNHTRANKLRRLCPGNNCLPLMEKLYILSIRICGKKTSSEPHRNRST